MSTTKDVALEKFSIEGEWVRLVPISEADIPASLAAARDPEVTHWTSVPRDQTEEDVRAWLARCDAAWGEGEATWSIRHTSDDRVLGNLVLRRHSDTIREVGYLILPEERGNGYMTEALRLVAAHAFGQMGTARLVWKACAGNWASWRTAWKCGFRREGVERGASGRDHVKDLWVGSLLAGEPLEPASAWDGPRGAAGPALDASRPGVLVAQFHTTYGLPDLVAERATPTLDTPRLGMRMSLIEEEFAELLGAVYGPRARALVEEATAAVRASDEGNRDIVETADALADLVYVIYGMALECGIDLDRVLAEVQASNLSKLLPDGSVLLREDGKVLKGPDFFPPNVRRALGLGQ